MKNIFELIGSYQYSSEALIMKGKLESEGIQVFIRDNYTVDTNPLYSNAVGGVKLFVNQIDYNKAKDVISKISLYSFDDNSKLIKCPNCREEQIKMTTSIKDYKSLFAFILSMLFVIMPFYSKYKYKCNSCGFEFN